MTSQLNNLGLPVINGWLHTSVDDLRSTLQCAFDNGNLGVKLPLLQEACDQAAVLGHKSRVQILERFIRLAKKGRP